MDSGVAIAIWWVMNNSGEEELNDIVMTSWIRMTSFPQYSPSTSYPVARRTPRLIQNFSKLSHGSAFVKISAIIFFVDTYSKEISPHSMRSRIKWCRMSICFALECETGLCARAIEPWLSACMIVTFVWGKSSSLGNVQSHIASFVAFADTIYSTLTTSLLSL